MAPVQPPSSVIAALSTEPLPDGVTLVDPTDEIEVSDDETCYGMLAAKRSVEGGIELYLSYDETSEVWWVLVHGAGNVIANGYLVNHREEAWQTFMYASEAAIRAVLLTEPTAPN